MDCQYCGQGDKLPGPNYYIQIFRFDEQGQLVGKFEEGNEPMMIAHSLAEED